MYSMIRMGTLCGIGGRRFFDRNAGANGSQSNAQSSGNRDSADDDGADGDSAASAKLSERARRVVELVRSGDLRAAGRIVDKLYDDNLTYRKRLRGDKDARVIADNVSEEVSTLTRENDDLVRENSELRRKIPAKNAVILTGDDAAAINKLRESGAKLADLPKVYTEHGTLTQKETERQTAEKFKTAARAAKFNPDAFARIAKAEGLDVQVVEVAGVNGAAPTHVAQIRRAGDSAAPWENATAFIDRELAVLKPALLAPEASANGSSTAGTNGNSTNSGSSGTAGSGSGFPGMPSANTGGGAGGGALVDKMLAGNARLATAPNPLRRPAPTPTK